jgi:hypothetical protein
MHNDRPRVWIQRNWGDGHRLYICQDTSEQHPSCPGSRIIKVANGFTWSDHCEGDAFDHSDGIRDPHDDLVQAIMDKAWEAGFRPTGFSEIKNETAALREHLADLKAIAFHQLKIKG